MRNPLQAIALMSAEEALLRATFVEREIWFRAMCNMPACSEEELDQLRLGWAVQIGNSMHSEIFAIFMAKFVVMVTKYVSCVCLCFRLKIVAHALTLTHRSCSRRPDRYTFNTGFQSSSTTDGDLLLTLLFELAVELVVDFLAVNAELKKKGVPIHLYYKLLTRETLLGQTVSSCREHHSALFQCTVCHT